MTSPEEVESKIPIIYPDYDEGIDFYFQDDFNKIGRKCPKSLSETDLEYCQGRRPIYCGTEYHEF